MVILRYTETATKEVFVEAERSGDTCQRRMYPISTKVDGFSETERLWDSGFEAGLYQTRLSCFVVWVQSQSSPICGCFAFSGVINLYDVFSATGEHVALESFAPASFSGSLDRFGGIQHRHLDAKCRDFLFALAGEKANAFVVDFEDLKRELR